MNNSTHFYNPHLFHEATRRGWLVEVIVLDTMLDGIPARVVHLHCKHPCGIALERRCPLHVGPPAYLGERTIEIWYFAQAV